MRGYDDTYAHARSQRRETRGYPRYFELTPVDDKVDASFPPSRNRDTIVKKRGKKKKLVFRNTTRDLSFEIFLSFRTQASTRLSHTLKIPRLLIVSSSGVYGRGSARYRDSVRGAIDDADVTNRRWSTNGRPRGLGRRGTTSFSG